MYITITPQKMGGNFSKSSADFVGYLEKENQGLEQHEMEHFFNQYGDEIYAEEVVKEIDGNTAKLEKHEPRFYSITVSPSKYELRKLQNSSEDLKRYTRELMKDYVASFNREIKGRPVNIDDIKYYAKIEHQRTFKGTDFQVKENQPFATKILQLKTEIRNIQEGRAEGNIKRMKKEITKLERQAPHQQNGKRIVQGMAKDGNQSHIHIIVSRKDASNRFSLSPGSKYKASDVKLNGETVKRGFDRDKFFEKAEKTFDKTFGYKRNFAETYKARKDFVKNPNLYFAALMKLPANEKALAFKMITKTGLPIVPSIPVSQTQIALRIFKRLRRGAEVAIKSSSIGI
ncbi:MULTISPECIES: MobB family relaxase [Maribacter]|uniref:MobB family relaxase n=1 Tax=Maribacter flavus TaxID=1658664 RepID=A0ABU7IDA0_9FLAO|nr:MULTISPECIES: MobB family relaxase [Maribacter]MDC6403687.1 MobB family relaxase [Maribacter sp. PR66]MEE1970828.1 MobB family relaxase [Maribacter flavus]NNK18289.1 mobilization protein [Maribacter sp.]NNK74952.1 mobilization protein [Maribacter sp.]|tara:strand:- start:26 stop:1057 length:1032 start_codon:yes stop_codon:yes gene_type:complete